MTSILQSIIVEHDIVLVVVAGLLCAFGSWVTASLYARARAKPRDRAMPWFLWTSFTAAVAMWSTHFVAMLGFRPNAPVSVEINLTFLSLAIAMLGCTIGILVAARFDTRAAPALGGSIVGLSLAAMHYSGMSAYRVDAVAQWDAAFLAASVALAVTLCALAFHLGHTATKWRDAKMVASLTFGVVSLHFTGMTAFDVEPMHAGGHAVNPAAFHTLAIAVASTAAIVVLSGLLYFIVENRIRQETFEELRRARNEAEAASRAKSEFLSVLSHELRTPLTIILGYAGILANMKRNYAKGLDPESLACLDHLERMGEQTEIYGNKVATAGRHLLSLINEILDYTRMELNDMTLSKSRFSLRALLDEAQADFEGLAAEKNARIVVDCDDFTLFADRRGLLQVAINLIGNALKFSGSPVITLRARLDGDDLRFEVEDRGTGIPEKSHDKIFQAFQQLEASDSRNHGGVGLGLAICKGIVAAHGGEITVRPTPGTGATFVVRIPACAPTAPAREETLPLAAE